MVWVLTDLVRGLTQLKMVPGMIGWDSDPYVLLSIGKIPLLLQKWRKKYSIKKWKKTQKQRYSLQQSESFFKLTKGLRNGCIKQQLTKVFSNSGMTLGTCRHVRLFGVGANCVIGRRKKMIGFGQAVDLKI